MLRKILGFWGRPKFAGLREVATVDAILIPPFGTHRVEDPIGISNKALGETARELNMLFENIPIGIQWEHLLMDPPIRIAKPAVGLAGANHITTRDFFLEIQKLHPTWKKVGILAHPEHALRSKWLAEKVGFEVVLVNPGKIPYDPTSLHWQARSYWRYLLWERLARVDHAIKGWI